MKITKEDRTMVKFLIQNKSHYKDKKIRNKTIWGIGERAIVLVDSTQSGDGYCGIRRYEGEKEFHNYFKKINNKNSFDDGIELAKEILRKFPSPQEEQHQRLLKVLFQSESLLSNKTLEDRLNDKVYLERLRMAYGD